MHREMAMSGRAAAAVDTFEVNKAIAAIAFLVQETGATMYSVMKMLYLADKTHLERHGRFITGDRYVAMQQGPVPSRSYNMVKHARGEGARNPEDRIVREFLSCDSGTHVISVLRQPDLDELSESDVECLTEIAGIYNRVGQWAVRDMSHDAAWLQAWKPGRRLRLVRSVDMPLESIASDVDDSGELARFLADRHPGTAEVES